MWRASDGDAREQEMSFWGWATLFFSEGICVCLMHDKWNASAWKCSEFAQFSNVQRATLVSDRSLVSSHKRQMPAAILWHAILWKKPRDASEEKNQFSRHAFETADRLWIIEQKCRGHVIPRLQFFSCSREDSRKMQSLTENKGELCNAQKPFRR